MLLHLHNSHFLKHHHTSSDGLYFLTVSFCFFFPPRAHAERSAEKNAKPGVMWDPSAGELSRVLHPGHALPHGRDSGSARLLCPGRHELLRAVFCRRGWQVRNELQLDCKIRSPLILVFNFHLFFYLFIYVFKLVLRYLAEWMTYGYPTANVWPLDIKRFGNLQSSRTFLRHRVMEVMRKYWTKSTEVM